MTCTLSKSDRGCHSVKIPLKRVDLNKKGKTANLAIDIVVSYKKFSIIHISKGNWLTVDKVAAGDTIARQETIYNHE